uniref:glutamate synthase (ferredoxin) n=1 Tax=Neogoniolithon spectabile TaxID=231755 RepID=A0A3G3MGZ8_9FLOR|nr:ferredoxin-dependent glutamate synthase [Neogoniolithon spectabile]AYR06118.1 ferredoxin-dependent glutamate synthase [Neogoniolithon spectabile]
MQVSKDRVYKLNKHLGYPAIINERDACGVGLIANIKQEPSHSLTLQALQALKCMEHRGACGADSLSGDGSGITTNIPWDLFSSLTNKRKNSIGLAMLFLPVTSVDEIRQVFEWTLKQNNFKLIQWRDVPVNSAVITGDSLKTQPIIQQCLVYSDDLEGDNLEKYLYFLRKKIENNISQANLDLNKQFYFCSFSSTIVVYKGMVRSEILGKFYQDLINPNYKINFAIYHRRFSTNTRPKWSLAQPMRFIAHNGEINTLLGNLNWMKSKEGMLENTKSDLPYSTLVPITSLENSDSANLDAVVELLISSGKSPQEALMILIPESYDKQPTLKTYPEIVDFYDYYAGLQEPWDGPALVVFTDGKIVGASLDRNGLRPARYLVTSDGLVIIASEAGVTNLDEMNIVEKGRLGPGQMLCVDMVNRLLLDNLLIKQSIASRLPYRQWLNQYSLLLENKSYSREPLIDSFEILKLHTAFGYTSEDVELVIEHMASLAKEPTFCMGDDTPLAVLSEKPHLIYNYFKQRFAQVTNPAIDPLRESLVMSLSVYIGPKGNILRPNEEMARMIKLKSPILNENELIELISSGFKIAIVNVFFQQLQKNLLNVVQNICRKVLRFVKQGAEIILLTDRIDLMTSDICFVPPLLIMGALHHYLISKKLRQRVSIVLETAQCWNTHHYACLIGYGASAVCPYMAFKTVRQWWYQPRTQKLIKTGKLQEINLQNAQHNYRLAIEAGLLKILSKMGISLLSSYHGAQIFEVLGLSSEVIELSFRGTSSQIGGLSLNEIYTETKSIYMKAFVTVLPKKLINLGYVQYRPSAEYHVNNPEMSKTLHKAVRSQDTNIYNKYKKLLEERPITNLRDLLEFTSNRFPISLSQVEGVDAILLRFCTGGMSLGALSRETHETLAIAMNRIGGKSNSGEGGEDTSRFYPIGSVNKLGTSEKFPHLKGLKINDIASSAIKQIASGRFGVTPEYLMNAKQLEIKIAQGAKPGEGGQLPGKKVSNYIAELRNCKPGVTLISPPPHHDIYSIEDLAQLIFDLHQINPNAQVSVKLVSEVGIGTIATGVAKANADIIQISGHDGGTGASPLSSIKHAGSPWELGLTEVHQTLVDNNLREKVLLRVDGGLRTGKDIIIAALMGAEEFGFGTVAMIATGCVMARICHTNNCPVGVASQRKALRNRYPGIPSDLVNFLTFIAEEVRQILAQLGYSRLQDIIGDLKLLKINTKVVKKTKNLDLHTLLLSNRSGYNLPSYPRLFVRNNGPVLDDILLNDPDLLNAMLNHTIYKRHIKVVNTDRTIGSRLAGKIAQKYGNYGFKGSIYLILQGSVGQSLGAFICRGIYLIVLGEANDYVGKGMSGGEIIVLPIKNTKYLAENQVILGNTALYGATGGILLANGRAGERFAVRNSSAQAVVSGAGDHLCEYMTGGTVVVLGPVGRNVGAGMTGGFLYVLDENQDLLSKVNTEIVKLQRIVTREGENHLLNLIKLYIQKTGSLKAQHIVTQWKNYMSLFWQIVPNSELNSPLANLEFSSFESLPKTVDKVL